MDGLEVGYCYAINGWMLKRSLKAGMAHDYDDVEKAEDVRGRHRREESGGNGERKDRDTIPGSERASTTALSSVMFLFFFGWAPVWYGSVSI